MSWQQREAEQGRQLHQATAKPSALTLLVFVSLWATKTPDWEGFLFIKSVTNPSRMLRLNGFDPANSPQLNMRALLNAIASLISTLKGHWSPKAFQLLANWDEDKRPKNRENGRCCCLSIDRKVWRRLGYTGCVTKVDNGQYLKLYLGTIAQPEGKSYTWVQGGWVNAHALVEYLREGITTQFRVRATKDNCELPCHREVTMHSPKCQKDKTRPCCNPWHLRRGGKSANLLSRWKSARRQPQLFHR
jgi:hypothetical protein